jgi:biotin carboxyl carrier protein
VTTNLPFLRWLVGHPDVRAGRTTTAFLVEHPPLSPPPVRAADAVWRDTWRLNLPPPAPAPPPDIDAVTHDGAAQHGESRLTAPMPGTVIKVLVREGEEVHARQPLLVLEAMKMETPVVAPYAARVKSVAVGEGAKVSGGALLVELEE